MKILQQCWRGREPLSSKIFIITASSRFCAALGQHFFKLLKRKLKKKLSLFSISDRIGFVGESIVRQSNLSRLCGDL